MLSLRLQVVLLFAVTAVLGAATVKFVQLKLSEIAERNGQGEVNRQITQSLAQRPYATLERYQVALRDNPAASAMVEAALAVQGEANSAPGSR